MSNFESIEKALTALQQLLNLLKAYRGHDHVHGINQTIAILRDSGLPLEDRIIGAKSIFKGMLGGMGSLGDFVIFSKIPHDQIKLNLELERLISQIWATLKC
jgi:hypothetical protein